MTASHGAKCVYRHTVHTYTYVCTHIARHRITFIHSFAGSFGFGLSIFLRTYTHGKCFQASPSHFDTCTHNFFCSFFAQKQPRSTITIYIYTHARTLISNAYLTEWERQRSEKLYITTISRFSNTLSSLSLCVFHTSKLSAELRKKERIQRRA